MNPKVILAQLGARMHYAVPEILYRNNLLHTFFSDLYLDSSTHYLLNQLSKIYSSGSINKLLGRQNENLAEANIKSFNTAGIKYSFQAKQTKTAQQYVRQCNLMAKDFNRKILQKGFENADTLYVFNTAGLELIKHAKTLGMKVILEQTIAPFALERVLTENELQKFPQWGSLKDYEMNDDFMEYIERERQEQILAELIIGGSEFVKKSIQSFSEQGHKTQIIPYGVDLPLPKSKEIWQKNKRKLRVLTIGAGLRKGTPYLLEVAKKLKNIAEFRLVGSLGNIPESVKKDIIENINYQGYVARSAVNSHYEWADIFLLPSVCEGSATVTYEALAYGLPVIATANSGTIIEHNLDGLIIEQSSTEAIENTLLSLYQSPENFQYLSKNALQKSQFGSLQAYENRLISLLN
ncbi:MAG: glycosyltransferase family 4 protein [Arcicella sp.]|nr:glycosyltransferase family 4 protein [Arcicella sp.]